jgi:hypothetical protein
MVEWNDSGSVSFDPSEIGMTQRYITIPTARRTTIPKVTMGAVIKCLWCREIECGVSFAKAIRVRPKVVNIFFRSHWATLLKCFPRVSCATTATISPARWKNRFWSTRRYVRSGVVRVFRANGVTSLQFRACCFQVFRLKFIAD